MCDFCGEPYGDAYTDTWVYRGELVHRSCFAELVVTEITDVEKGASR